MLSDTFVPRRRSAIAARLAVVMLPMRKRGSPVLLHGTMCKVSCFVSAVFLMASICEAALTGRIAFGDASNAHIYVMDAAGGPALQLPVPPMGYVQAPTWSSDGQWITFGGGPVNNGGINVIRADGSDYRAVTGGIGPFSGMPTFFPDGQRIAFEPGKIINTDGTDLVSLGTYMVHLRVSPDGTRIAYTNWGQTYDSDIFIYDLSSGISTQVTHHEPGEAFNGVAWSPDSSKLAVNRLERNTGNWDVWTMNTDGSNALNLTADLVSSSESWPWWSLDGQDIVYISNVSGSNDIWAMHADGSQRMNLTNTPDIEEVFPAIGVPEPATLSLLALGGLAVMRRKR